MKKLFFYILVLFSVNLFAQADLFEEANAAYAEENYNEAIEKYEQILENGETAAAVHFNLANAHYKLNHVAPSIYHYEKALQLAPADEDIENNLQFARNMALDVIEESPETGFSRWLNSVTSIFTLSGWAWAAVNCMLLFVLLFLLFYFSRKPLPKRIFFISGILFLILAVTSVGLGYTKANVEANENEAIVFAEEVSVRSEPDERGPEVFVLHEGSKVEVLEDFQGWKKIELSNGNQGWMRSENLKIL